GQGQSAECAWRNLSSSVRGDKPRGAELGRRGESERHGGPCVHRPQQAGSARTHVRKRIRRKRPRINLRVE
ncbi:MAG: hypothetical protein ACK56I_32320, partial [bacterium]